MKSSSVALIIAFLALIVGGGLYFYSGEEDVSDKQIYDDGISDVEDEMGEMADEDEIIMASPEKTDLIQVSEIEGSAVANRVFSGGEFIHTVVAELPALDEGFYEGWLVGKIDGQTEFFSTGKIEEDDGVLYLEYRSETDKSSFNEVVITLELEDDGLPEKHVLEGTF